VVLTSHVKVHLFFVSFDLVNFDSLIVFQSSSFIWLQILVSWTLTVSLIIFSVSSWVLLIFLFFCLLLWYLVVFILLFGSCYFHSVFYLLVACLIATVLLAFCLLTSSSLSLDRKVLCVQSWSFNSVNVLTLLSRSSSNALSSLENSWPVLVFKIFNPHQSLMFLCSFSIVRHQIWLVKASVCQLSLQ